MAILHIVNKSPFERNSLESALAYAKNGSGILLIEDAVYGASEKTKFADAVKSRVGDVKVYVLDPDYQARGLGNIGKVDGVEAVDYKGFVDLVAQFDVAQSWL